MTQTIHKPKRILIFSLTYFPFIGGAEIAVKEITDRIASSAVSFDMITLRFDTGLPRKECIGAVTVHRVGFTKSVVSINDTFTFPLSLNKYLFPFLAFFRAWRLHKAHSYDSIWSIMANYAGFAALFFKRFHSSVPFVLTIQEGDPIEYIKRRVRFVYPVFKRIFTSADIIQTISTHLANFARHMGYDGPLVVIPNGVDVERFKGYSGKEAVETLRHQLGIKEDYHVLVTASRLVEKNAVDDIIRSLTHLPDTTILLVAGEGPDEDTLKHLADKLHVGERVVFLGQLSHDELAVLYGVANVFVRPSLSEGMGNAFVEAMAASVPVVATPVGGIPDFLIDPSSKLGKVTPTGLFCGVRNPKSIAEKVTTFLEDDVLREKIVSNARQLVREKYNWNRVAQAMCKDVFTTVLDERS